MNPDLVQAPSSVHYLLLKLHMATETHDLPEDEAEARRRAVHAESLGWKYMRVCGCIQTPGSEVQAHKLLPQVSLRVPPAWLGLVLVSVSSLPFSLVLLSAPTKYSGFAAVLPFPRPVGDPCGVPSLGFSLLPCEMQEGVCFGIMGQSRYSHAS